MFDQLTEDNILIYAIKMYDSPNCIRSEFKDDFKRFRYLNRLFRRYQSTGEFKDRLILNHLIVIYNVFGAEAGTRLLFYYIQSDYYTMLKTVLIFLNYMPDTIAGINGQTLYSSDIPVDMRIAQILRTLR